MAKLLNLKTLKEVNYTVEEAEAGILSGTIAPKKSETFIVRDNESPDDAYEVTGKQVREALASGMRLETPTEAAVADYVYEKGALKGALQVGATQLIDEFAMGIPEMIYNGTADPLDVAKREALKKAHSGVNALAGITGAGLSLLYGPMGVVGKASSAVGDAALGFAEKQITARLIEAGATTGVKGAAKKLAAGAIETAAKYGVEGAVSTLPVAITEAGLALKKDDGTLDYSHAAEALASNVTIGALLGTAIGGTIQGANGIYRVMRSDEAKALATNVGKKAAKVLTGVDEADIDHYVANRDAVNGAMSIEELKDKIDDVTTFLDDAHEGARQSVVEAKANAQAQANARRQELRQRQIPEEMPSKINQAIELQKKKVVDGSKAAGNMVDEWDARNADKTLQIGEGALEPRQPGLMTQADYEKAIERAIDAYVPAGPARNTPAVRERISKITRFLVDTQQLGDDISAQFNASKSNIWLSGRSVKDTIKHIDDSTRGTYGQPGAFDAIDIKILKRVRHEYDQKLKNIVPGYREAMVPVQKDAAMLDAVMKTWGRGTESTIGTKLESMFKDNFKGKAQRKMLSMLGESVGTDLLTDMAIYESEKRVLGLGASEEIKRRLAPQAYAELDAAQKRLAEFERHIEPVKRLTKNRSQAVVKNMFGNNVNIEDERALEALTKLRKEIRGDDFNYTEALKNARTKHRLETSYTQGSRRVNLGAILGAPAGAGGMIVGGLAGAAMDKYGGRMTKAVVDGLLDHRGGVLNVEQHMKAIANKIDALPERLQRVVKATSRPSSIAAINRLISGGDSERVKSRTEAFHQLSRKLDELEADPQKAMGNVSNALQPWAESGATKISEQATATLMRGMSYLQQFKPKQPRPDMPFSGYKWSPSDLQLSSFERRLEGVMNPTSIIDDIATGTATSDKIHAVQNVYPALFQSIIAGIMKAGHEGKHKLDYSRRVMLARMLGVSIDPSLDSVRTSELQALHESGLGNDGVGTQGGGATLNVAEASKTESQKIAS